MKTILITGGTGFIGSHACVALAQAGHQLVILDNLCNSRADVIDRLATLCGKRPLFIQGDIRDSAILDSLFAAHPINAVMHFAGLKAVGESAEKPLDYYDNNVTGTLQLLAAMGRAAVKTLVFSSSATVYGDPANVPICEDFPRAATNPYGRTKLMIEDIQDELGCVQHHGFQLFVAELSPAVTVHPSVLGQWAGILRELAPLNGFIKHLVQRSIVVVLGTAREFAPHPVSPPHVEL